MRPRMIPTFLAFLALQTSPAIAQEPPGHGGGGQGDVMEKITKLFNEVGRDLDEIDRLLLEASSPKAAQRIEETVKKMDSILDSAGQKQGEAADKMGEIIKLVPRQGGGGGGGAQPPPPSSKPQDGQQEGQQPRESENRSDKPQELDPNRDSQNPQNSNARKQPDSPEEATGDPFQEDGPDQAKKDPGQRQDQAGGWSVHLPPKEVQVFKNHLRDTQIPERYHRMIERWRQLRRR